MIEPQDRPEAELKVVLQSTVEQAIDGPSFGLFDKEVLRAELPWGRSLALVRKRPMGRQCQGCMVLLHGFAQNRYSWHLSTRSFANYFAEAGFDVYNLELTGHGRSRDFGTPPAESFHHYIEDTAPVVRAIAKRSGFQRVFLVGHSLGGAVAYCTAPQLQDELAGIVSIAGIFSFGANPITRALGRFVQRNRELGLESWLRNLKAGVTTRRLGSLVASRWREADWLSQHFPLAGWVPGSTEPHIVQERLLRGFDWTGLNVLLTMMGWAAEGKLADDTGKGYEEAFLALNLPLLVLAGDHDRMLTPQDALPAVERSCSQDKTFEVLGPEQGGAHWGHLDLVLGKHAPSQVWPRIEQWLKERGGS